ncbi:MAG: hypothetical protein GX986_00275 [Firmicutes bacterium]|nr:hypothetical protein [Bacillota bacterium]
MIEPFHSKIAGVTRNNPDGTSRQELLAQCQIGQSLKLVREPDNSVDENAIMVLTMDGKQLGYLNKAIAAHVASKVDKGIQVDCEISDLTGGEIGKETRGCNVKITMHGLICNHCGKGVPADSNYCLECGGAIDSSDKPAGEKTGTKRGCLGCFGFIVLAVILIVVLSNLR